jgi:hypothetical protein
MLKNLLVLFFEQLELNNVDYCVVGNYYELPEYTSNDVDLWAGDTDVALSILLKCSQQIGLKLYMQNKTANGSNNYFYVVKQGKIDIIKIDLMRETAYKSVIPIVTSDLIKKNRIKYKNFFVANELLEPAHN